MKALLLALLMTSGCLAPTGSVHQLCEDMRTVQKQMADRCPDYDFPDFSCSKVWRAKDDENFYSECVPYLEKATCEEVSNNVPTACVVEFYRY